MNARSERFEDIDVVVVSVLIDTEHPALLKTFGFDPFSKAQAQRENLKFWFPELRTVENKHLRVVLTCFGDKGNVASSLLTRRILDITHPKLAYLVGTAAGRRSRVSICDVVVSTTCIMYYEPGRLRTEVGGTKPEFVHTKPLIKNEVKHFYARRARSLGWADEYGSTLEALKGVFHLARPTREPEVHFEAIASGEKLLNGRMLESISEQHDSIYAGEMEGYGFAKACEDSETDWLVIRGISDFGKREEREQWKIAATVMACSFAKILLRHASRPPSEGPGVPPRGEPSGLGKEPLPYDRYITIEYHTTIGKEVRRRSQKDLQGLRLLQDDVTYTTVLNKPESFRFVFTRGRRVWQKSHVIEASEYSWFLGKACGDLRRIADLIQVRNMSVDQIRLRCLRRKISTNTIEIVMGSKGLRKKWGQEVEIGYTVSSVFSADRRAILSSIHTSAQTYIFRLTVLSGFLGKPKVTSFVPGTDVLPQVVYSPYRHPNTVTVRQAGPLSKRSGIVISWREARDLVR